jgi:hypothetical protein
MNRHEGYSGDDMEFQQSEYPMDSRLANSENLIFRTMSQHCMEEQPFRDARIDDNETLRELANFVAIEFGSLDDRMQDTEDVMHGMRCGYALARNARIMGNVRLDDGLEHEFLHDYYGQLLDAVDVYGANSMVARWLSREAREYIQKDITDWNLAKIGMFMILYMANAGEAAKDRDDRAGIESRLREATITRYERQLREEGEEWARTDRQLLDEMRLRFRETAGPINPDDFGTYQTEQE